MLRDQDGNNFEDIDAVVKIHLGSFGTYRVVLRLNILHLDVIE